MLRLIGIIILVNYIQPVFKKSAGRWLQQQRIRVRFIDISLNTSFVIIYGNAHLSDFFADRTATVTKCIGLL